MRMFIAKHAYALLIAGSLLDAGTTWFLISSGNGWELNPIMAFYIAHLGITLAMVVKIGLTAAAGLALKYTPRALRLLAIAMVGVGIWNLVGVGMVLVMA
jgi:hypothetical protein